MCVHGRIKAWEILCVSLGLFYFRYSRRCKKHGVGMIASFYFLSLVLRSLPLGTAYAIWTGIGTVGTVILGIILFKEPIDMIRLICIGAVLIGVIGLKMSS
ncbi:MAG: multidrug efflux SMR transporter [Clostridiaceae bacterium]|nr:multidrug efflux SMR transporter [Clostridiaceae bacterium]